MKSFTLFFFIVAVLLLMISPAVAQKTNIIPSYISSSNSFTIEEIGGSQDLISKPRDLDFHPYKRELWIINQGTENSGGSTVTFYNPGKSNQQSLYRKDGNAWHFMSLPSGIAFSSDNGNFATSPSVYDANHKTSGPPFTGPTLWSSDSLIYAKYAGPGTNGSHLDMLHVSPYAMGIAHEEGNAFWVFDGHTGDIVMYDFRNDHGPGNGYHGDGVIMRYPVPVKWISQNISSHLVLDEEKKWLYIADGGNQRILRLDITSGSYGGNANSIFQNYESVIDYSYMTGIDFETVVDNGLNKPVGIEIIRDYLLVSDYENGDIIIYNVSSVPATKVGTVSTGHPGIQGIVVGPDGMIWYVNYDQSKVYRIVPDEIIAGVEIEEATMVAEIFPNPAINLIHIQTNIHEGFRIRMNNLLGATVYNGQSTQEDYQMDVSSFPAGIYLLNIISPNGKNKTEKIIINDR